MTFAVTLLFDLIFGYTINRVTLFALILSLGLPSDDPSSMSRIFTGITSCARNRPCARRSPQSMKSVRPTILATFAVILSFIPMFYITGMMGPYMAPMAFNVPIAMLLSLIIAFTVTPGEPPSAEK